MQIKSENESRSQGAGQLLISAVVNAVKFDCNVMGLLIHPMKVRVTIFYFRISSTTNLTTDTKSTIYIRGEGKRV